MTLPARSMWVAFLAEGALLLAQAPPITNAQDDQLLTTLFNTPIETASKRPQDPLQSPQAVELITAKQIQAAGVFRLMDILRLATNVQIMDSDGTLSRLGIRGVAPNGSPKTIQVLVDGVPLYNPGALFLDIESIPVPVDAIERVEIVRGPSSTLYGANAQLGVISITTKSAGKEGVSGSLRAGWGQGGTANGQGLLSYGSQAFALTTGLGGLSRQQLNEPYQVIGTGLPYQPENAYHQSQVLLKPEVWIGQDTRLWASFTRSEKVTSAQIAVRADTLAPLIESPYGRFTTAAAQVGWNQTWTTDLCTEVKVLQSSQVLGLGPIDTAPGSVAPGLKEALLALDPTYAGEAHSIDITTRQLAFQVNWDPSQAFHLVAGGDTRRMETPGSPIQGIPASQPTGTGGFLSLDWSLHPLTLSVGARVENETLGGSRTSPRATLVWSLDPTTTLRAGYFTSTRSPQIAEEQQSFNNAVNPYIQVEAVNLKPEEAENLELGFRKILPWIAIDLTFYHTTLRRLIVNTLIATTPRLTSQFQNSPAQRVNRGLEASLTANLGASAQLGLNGAFVDYQDPTRGTQADWAPKTSLTLWTRASFGKLFGFAALQHIDSYTLFSAAASPNRETLPARLQASFNLGVDVSKSVRISAYGVNAARTATSESMGGSGTNLFLVRHARRELGLQASYRF